MTDLATDYASRLRAVAKIVDSLGPDRRDPHRFPEQKDAAVKSLQQLAGEVELDQVFAKLPAHPRAERCPMSARPRTVRDHKGRPVPVETKRPLRRKP